MVNKNTFFYTGTKIINKISEKVLKKLITFQVLFIMVKRLKNI